MRQPAILLIGPTGSGKTPAGDWLQDHGFAGRRCHHFDFGANLRSVAEGEVSGFAPDEIRLIRDVLEKGALLENESFPIALRILDSFCARRIVLPEDFLVMNGLPRHAGQAESLAGRIDFAALLQLHCDAAVVLERLRNNSGGDREHRKDDTLPLVQRKLAIFEERTRPLIAYYLSQGVPVIPVEVTAASTPEDIARAAASTLV